MASIDFEKRKKELLDKINSMRQQQTHESVTVAEGTVAVFATESPFIDELISIIGKKHPVRVFSDAEQMIAFCTAHPDLPAILDMDQPTDWKMSTDVFSAVKTINPGIRVILCTKNPSSHETQTLVSHKADVLAVPFSADQLFHMLRSGPHS